MQTQYDVVVVGAGIAGIASAWALARAVAGRIALVDQGAPLALTSDKSTECYRNFWPGPDRTMADFVSDSIDLLQHYACESGDQFQLHQRGYLFATGRESEIETLRQQALLNASYGSGPLREHTPAGGSSSYRASPASGFVEDLNGADLITDASLIRQQFPYLTHDTIGVLHVRRCGVLSAQQLGMYLLERARDAGVVFLPAEFASCDTSTGRISSIELKGPDGSRQLHTNALVLASGPHLKATAVMAGSDLPVVVEKHVKISLADSKVVIPRDAPLTIWNDPVDLGWTDEERASLAESPETAYLTDTFPAGVHGRPVGAGDQVFLYWTYDCPVSDTPTFPIEGDPHYPEILLRGMARMIPGLNTYLDPMPRPYVDGGYYTKVADNRPLIGPLKVPGTFVCSAFSGYGIMAACAAGELVTSHVLGRDLPDYASALLPQRFDNPAYLEQIADLSGSGQI
jgi:glycine/D-amino acid oxidase-like deaminating enzyme